ncbi:hypothetical protein INT45_002068 [Circinella minor]|uniref:Uncharacterized protein n=1 Tax=Circinella minor TaxID=1195481 RepID=A0A8H7SDZ8_9FUNG|nr:hypothetical protein INT45_002068 [Circinella minor]
MKLFVEGLLHLFDNPARKELGDSYPLPQIEMCSENSSMTIVRCDLMHMNWSMSTIPNCYDYIAAGEASDTLSRCYLFDSGDTFKYGVVEDYEPTASNIRRIDIYWKVDLILNSSLASISVPSITMELYTEGFSRWALPDYVPKLLEKDIIFGGSRLINSENTTSTILFTSNLYRAIKPGDLLSMLGFGPDYIEFPRVEATHLEWPLQENEDVTRGDYHGIFNVQMAKAGLDIQSERRQHTILSAIALAGGAYGAFSTLYILLFGKLRLSPFGVFHQIPIIALCTVKAIHNKRCKNSRLNDDDLNDSKTDQFLLDDPAQPSKLDNIYISTFTNIPADSGTNQQSHSSSGNDRSVQLTDSSTSWDRDCRSDDGSSCANNNGEQSSQNPNHDENPATIKRIHQLERQVSELQHVLREYYIDMNYLDNHRNMRRR